VPADGLDEVKERAMPRQLDDDANQASNCASGSESCAGMWVGQSPQSLLLPIAEQLAKFVCEEDFANVKACEGDNCTLMFADHTRRRGRRW
jgi:predicted RNA-binding Zn ribbon-like protein